MFICMSTMFTRCIHKSADITTIEAEPSPVESVSSGGSRFAGGVMRSDVSGCGGGCGGCATSGGAVWRIVARSGVSWRGVRRLVARCGVWRRGGRGGRLSACGVWWRDAACGGAVGAADGCRPVLHSRTWRSMARRPTADRRPSPSRAAGQKTRDGRRATSTDRRQTIDEKRVTDDEGEIPMK